MNAAKAAVFDRMGDSAPLLLLIGEIANGSPSPGYAWAKPILEYGIQADGRWNAGYGSDGADIFLRVIARKRNSVVGALSYDDLYPVLELADSVLTSSALVISDHESAMLYRSVFLGEQAEEKDEQGRQFCSIGNIYRWLVERTS